MFRSRGASIPRRTLLGPIRTIVTVTLSPILIFSPVLRDRTSIAFSLVRLCRSFPDAPCPAIAWNSGRGRHAARYTSEAPVNSCAFFCHQSEYVLIRITIRAAENPVRLRKCFGCFSVAETRVRFVSAGRMGERDRICPERPEAVCPIIAHGNLPILNARLPTSRADGTKSACLLCHDAA